MQKTLFLMCFVFFLAACQSNNSNEDTANTEIEAPLPNLPSTISTTEMRAALGITNMVPGQGIEAAIENATKKIVKGTVENGEGIFDVYKIMDDDGEELANIYCIENDAMIEVPQSVQITSNRIATPEGLKVGDSYEKMQATYSDFTISGSEIEGWTYARLGEVYIRVSAYNPIPDSVSVAPDDKVVFIEFEL
ncbi:MAG: hypothetical protein AAF705_05935 [Bacteroidota bacterium]